MEVNFHIQLLVGRCTLASAKGFQNGVKNILKSHYPLVFHKNLLSIYHEGGSVGYPFLSERENTLIPSVQRACGPEHLRASQTCYCSISCCQTQPVPLRRTWIARRTTQLFSRTESRSLSELTRQITPPTKNGHAPPPTESRKSSQSVNPSSVRAW